MTTAPTGDPDKVLSDAQRRALAACCPDRLHWDVSMANHSTLKAGGITQALADIHSLAELRQLLRHLHAQRLSWRVIGRGSNILVSAPGFPGVLIRLGGEFRAISRRERESENGAVVVHVGAGCSLSRLISWGMKHDLGGLEFLAGIPGGLGGAVWMNAGAWGSAIGDQLLSVSYVDSEGQLHEIARADLAIAYRQIRVNRPGSANWVIVGATLRMTPQAKEEIQAACRHIVHKRRAKQPTTLPSAGSVFKNPPGDSAGRLIEAAGLKGLRRGGAMVSPKHANFIVNTGQATATDILELMQEVQRRVYEFSGIHLEAEVNVL